MASAVDAISVRVDRRPRRDRGIDRPDGYYLKRLEEHRARGRTRPVHSARTRESLKGIKRKLQRLCPAIQTTVKDYLRNLDFGQIKIFFDWLRDKHRNTIGSANTLNTYWRELKVLYVRETGRVLDEGTRSDCVNDYPLQYKNRLIKSWGLRTLPKKKPTGTTDFLYVLLRYHWERCPKAYADEKQRLYVSVVQLLAFVSGCRPVSILDTRGKKSKMSEKQQPTGRAKRCKVSFLNDQSQGSGDDVENIDIRIAKCQRFKRKISAPEGKISPTPPRGAKKRRIVSSAKEDRFNDKGSASESGDDTGPNSGYSSVDSLDDDTDPMFDTEDNSVDHDGSEEPGYDSDYKPTFKNEDCTFIKDHVDDAYDAGPENTGALLWRHIQFHIVRSPVKGRRNILLAKITLLHTKGEDKKPRVKTFTIGHHPDPVFDLLGQLLALAVADGVFAASIQDVKVIYDYPIPSYLLGEPLKYKPKNLDQP
ncbi:hypothetical protein LOZ66_006984, partial [Ophidiomyces ophidiicola]